MSEYTIAVDRAHKEDVEVSTIVRRNDDNSFTVLAQLEGESARCIADLQARVKVLEEQKELIASDLWAQEQESKRMWEYINDHVHSFIDSDEGEKLLSYYEWKELGSNPTLHSKGGAE